MCYRQCTEFFERVEECLMDFDLYMKIIDQCARYGVYSIRLSLRGETLMHPKVVEMVRYAKKKGIKEVSFLTNALLLTKEMSESLIDAGLDWMTVSFDGLGETYEKIRAPAKFNETLDKLKFFQRIKRQKGKKKPVLKVQGIQTAVGENPEEFKKIFEKIADEFAFNPLIDYSKPIVHNPNYVCPVPWQRLVIMANGNIVQCVNDFNEYNVIGNANTDDLRKVWRGKGMTHLRRVHSHKKAFKCMKACIKCDYGSIHRSQIDHKKELVQMKTKKKELVSVLYKPHKI
jgi:radical SAM protein with 4Fe4S-binding SPASM domain